MRVGHLALVGLLLVGCSEQEPAGPPVDAKSDRVAQIEAMLTKIAASQGMTYSAGCYPPRDVTGYELPVLAHIAITAAQMETEGWEIVCASFGYPNDSYGAVHPDAGLIFQCPIGDGLVIVMRRGSIADGSAECAVVQ